MICPHCTKETQAERSSAGHSGTKSSACVTETDLEKQKHEHEKAVQNEFMQKLFSSMMSGKKENTKQVINEFNGKLPMTK